MKMSDNDDEEVDNVYVPSPKVKEHRVTKQNVLQTVDVVQVVKHHQVVMIRNIDKGKGKKGQRGRKKKETNNPYPQPPLVVCNGYSYSVGVRTNINVERV